MQFRNKKQYHIRQICFIARIQVFSFLLKLILTAWIIPLQILYVVMEQIHSLDQLVVQSKTGPAQMQFIVEMGTMQYQWQDKMAAHLMLKILILIIRLITPILHKLLAQMVQRAFLASLIVQRFITVVMESYQQKVKLDAQEIQLLLLFLIIVVVVFYQHLENRDVRHLK